MRMASRISDTVRIFRMRIIKIIKNYVKNRNSNYQEYVVEFTLNSLRNLFKCKIV